MNISSSFNLCYNIIGDIMKDTKEVVLFFKGDVNFSSVDIAKEFLSRYEYLGEPVILPDNGDPKITTIMFSSNPEMHIQISRIAVNVAVNYRHFNEIASIIFDITDIFDGEKIEFNRIGYISSLFISSKLLPKVKEKYLNKDNLSDIGSFNLGFYRSIDNKKSYFNCWERVIADSNNASDILIQYDLNSAIDENFDFSMKNIKDFINFANDYIEKRINI